MDKLSTRRKQMQNKTEAEVLIGKGKIIRIRVKEAVQDWLQQYCVEAGHNPDTEEIQMVEFILGWH